MKMKRIEEITQRELDLMKRYMYYTTYTPQEYNEVVGLIRDWVNSNVSNCATCGSNTTGKYKNQLNELYLAHHIKMQEIIDTRAKEEQPIVNEPVKDITPEQPSLNYDKGFNEEMNKKIENGQSMFKKGKKK